MSFLYLAKWNKGYKEYHYTSRKCSLETIFCVVRMCLFSVGFNYEFCIVCSKKDVEIRTSELLDAVSEPLLEAIENDAGSWISSSSIGMVTLAVLKSGKGEWDGSTHWLLLN